MGSSVVLSAAAGGGEGKVRVESLNVMGRGEKKRLVRLGEQSWKTEGEKRKERGLDTIEGGYNIEINCLYVTGKARVMEMDREGGKGEV